MKVALFLLCIQSCFCVNVAYQTTVISVPSGGSNIVDGNVSSSWNVNPNAANTYAILDLGGIYEIDSISILLGKHGDYGVYVATSYDATTNSAMWSQVHLRTGNVVIFDPPQYEHIYNINMNASFVKFQNLNQNDGRQIFELVVNTACFRKIEAVSSSSGLSQLFVNDTVKIWESTQTSTGLNIFVLDRHLNLLNNVHVALDQIYDLAS